MREVVKTLEDRQKNVVLALKQQTVLEEWTGTRSKQESVPQQVQYARAEYRDRVAAVAKLGESLEQLNSAYKAQTKTLDELKYHFPLPFIIISSVPGRPPNAQCFGGSHPTFKSICGIKVRDRKAEA